MYLTTLRYTKLETRNCGFEDCIQDNGTSVIEWLVGVYSALSSTILLNSCETL